MKDEVNENLDGTTATPKENQFRHNNSGVDDHCESPLKLKLCAGNNGSPLFVLPVDGKQKKTSQNEKNSFLYSKSKDNCVGSATNFENVSLDCMPKSKAEYSLISCQSLDSSVAAGLVLQNSFDSGILSQSRSLEMSQENCHKFSRVSETNLNS